MADDIQPITAATITDSEIIKVRMLALGDGPDGLDTVALSVIATVTVGSIVNGEPVDELRKFQARGKCAEYLNAWYARQKQ